MTIKSDVIPWPHTIKVGTNYNLNTTPWSIINPTQNIDLKDYPDGTECYHVLINFTNLYNRAPLTVTFIFRKTSTGAELFRYKYVIPATTSYWSWYSVVAWIGHFDWEINEPGDYSCQIIAQLSGGITTTAETIMHITETITPPPEPPTPTTPEGFIGWIWSFLIEPVVQLIARWFNDNIVPIWKLVSDKFMGFLNWVISLTGSVADFITEKISGFFTWVTEGFKSFANWINTIGGDLVKWLQSNIAGIIGWITEKFLGFVKWVSELPGTIADYIKAAAAATVSWITEKFLGFVKWLQEINGSIASYISGAVAGFVNWTQEQLGAIWKGLESLVGGWIEGLTKSFFQGLNIGIVEGGHSPLDTEKETDNEILLGLQKYMINYRKERDKKKVK